METIIQISEVNSKDVNTSRGASTVYNVKASDGKEFSTFKKDLGQAAGQLRGQWATVEYTEVQKGKYTNYYLDSVKPAQGLTTLPGATHSEVVVPLGNPVGTVGTFSAPGVTHNIHYKDDKSAQINRSVAFKAAVELISSGFVDYPGVDGIDKLTNELISVVEGNYTSPLAQGPVNPSSGEAGAAEVDLALVKF